MDWRLPEVQTSSIQRQTRSRRVTLELTPPRGATAVGIHAAAHVASGSPPRPEVKYAIDFSLDGGKSWLPLVKGWNVNRRGEEPKDFWSQSFCWASKGLSGAKQVRVRFQNDGGRPYRGRHEASHVFTPRAENPWRVLTGRNVRTHWVEFTPVVR